jgi:TRAP-type C4-dicarboxylate transport system permease small subunit
MESEKTENKRKHLAQVKREIKEMKNLTFEKLSALLTTAFGLVAALAWNTAIQEWFKNNPYLNEGGPWVYAILVTIIAVIATMWISRITAKINTEKEEDLEKKQE